MTAASPKTVVLCIFLFLASALVTLSFRSPHASHWSSHLRHSNKHSPATHPPAPKVAFATFLGGNANPDAAATDEESAALNDSDDGYFIGTRVLAYQLLHSPVAGTNSSIPFLVFVTEDVSPRKRARLTKDGATVIQVEKLVGDALVPNVPRWRDMLTKLRMWEYTTYSKICYIDADMLITKRLDGIFWDEATLTQSTSTNPNEIKSDEAPLPRTYTFAGHADFWGYDHAWPPPTDSTYVNAGFFVFTPSLLMQAYYLSLLAVPGKVTGGMMEQDLLNYAHRREGNMPWKPIWYGWNVNWPTEKDWKAGAASFHAKYWDGDPSHDPVLKAIWREQRAEMEGFYRGREMGLKREKKDW